MRTEQNHWHDGSWHDRLTANLGASADLVLSFGATDALAQSRWMSELREAYPNAKLFGCSTAGEILGTRVLDDSIVATAVGFDRTPIALTQVDVHSSGGSHDAGQRLASALAHEGLAHVLVLCDGQGVNGSELVRGMCPFLPEGVRVTGGLAGDGARFERTLVVADAPAQTGTIAAVGFYGDRIHVGYGSMGGWDPFGPERVITRSEGNVLYELDDKPALDLYKMYLGDHADGLPATGLLFPLRLRRPDTDESLVRTILAIDEAKRSLTFAGDMPEGSTARLMKANFDRLIEGAAGAARTSSDTIKSDQGAELAILISCVGRKLVLKQRTEEEVEAVQEVLGKPTTITGYYSYGEICPSAPNASCELHNQTMTITSLREA